MGTTASHVLVAAFRPFGGRSRNESERAMRALSLPAAQSRKVKKLLLPVSWRRSVPVLEHALSRPGLCAVVLTGEAGRRGVVTPERWARNAAARIRDEDGSFSPSSRLRRLGPSRRRGTWEAAEVVRLLRAAGHPAAESRDAGAFLCNAVYWRALEDPNVRRLGLPVVFVHLPVPGAGALPDLTPARLARALSSVVRSAVERFAKVERKKAIPARRGRGRRPRSRRP